MRLKERSLRHREMKEINVIYKMLLTQMRKHDEKYKQIPINGEEIHIPTRSGERRALIYKPQPESTALPVLFDFHGARLLRSVYGPQLLS